MLRLMLAGLMFFAAGPSRAQEGRLSGLVGALGLAEFPGTGPALEASAPVPVPDQPAKPVARRIRLDIDKIEFDDGDTVSYPFSEQDGVKGADGRPYGGELRLLGFDTPEVAHPQHGIFYNQEQGPEAADLARRLISEAKIVEFFTTGRPDKYGRILGYITINGKLLGVSEIEAGLAYETVSVYGDAGFPDFARQITDAWKNSPLHRSIEAGEKPAYINPHLWRKINQYVDAAVPRERWDAMSEREKADLIERARQRARERDLQMGSGT